MAINKFSVVFAFFCIIIIGSSGCECVGGARHAFNEKITFEPEYLEYHLGDTIWMTSKFSCKNLFNAVTGQTEDYCGVENIALSLQLFLLEPWPQDSLSPTPAAQLFDFLNINGSALPADDRNVNVYFGTMDDDYLLKIGIIPRNVGQYFFAVAGGGTYELPDSKKCDTGSFGFSPDVKDNHISLLETFKKGAQNVTEYEKEQVYCFEVMQ